MDKLEKYIIDKRDELDVYEPNPALWEGIEKSINKKPVLRLHLGSIIWKAAAVIAIIASSVLVIEVIYNNKLNMVAIAEGEKEVVIPELKEAEVYYNQVMQTKLSEINPALKEYPDLHDELHKDLAELDSMYRELKDDLKDNVSTDEVIHAMIQNYRLRIDLLEDLLNEVNELEEDKRTMHQPAIKKSDDYDI